MSHSTTLQTLNDIIIANQSGLDSSKYTVWVAGFMQQAGDATGFYILQPDGSFAAATTTTQAQFIDINAGLTVKVPDVTNSGNNRLVFTVTKASTTPADYPLNGYTAYPFNAAPGVCPPGPYDIFEFGPNAQYDVSAVDAFGINLSFSVSGDASVYGAMVPRSTLAATFASFTQADPNGAAFEQLLFTSPTGEGYPELIEAQFSAIVSPKDWLAIYPSASGLSGYWSKTTEALFSKGNQINFYLNGATVGTYSGSSDGTQFTLSGPNGLSITIPKADFEGDKPFFQAVRAQNSNESVLEYQAFGQIEAAIFEAFSRGVVLDGVVDSKAVIKEHYTSDAWTNTDNWYTDHPNSYNNAKSLYDVYAKFFHCATIPVAVATASGKDKTEAMNIFGKNTAGTFAMAYGFSLDENPNVGSSTLGIPTQSWPSSQNVPSKTPGNVGSGQTVSLTLGAWKPSAA
ncbi:hypothetical protein Sden_2918 [Shewanella denitrificans OS217]|uniref:Uncharacterized protein n=1 Tax=Shewanella denitrificans (strain OS217 / ATCC BAA-1090 / DSM 15013) TaxID=318161 RepID=Q12K30_SHEDO|nr:hypothetical protein [Shewanella denitrificans]ABE56196.1 hypothetical protein Sden_2918 [Shewanella denitrificans OS217]